MKPPLIEKLEQQLNREILEEPHIYLLTYNHPDCCYRLDKNVVEMLSLCDCGLKDISFLSGFKHIAQLDLSGNRIEDISPLKDLPSLRYLKLSENRIADISVLQSLTGLKHLLLQSNPITNCSSIQNLRSLESLSLDHCKIKSLSLDNISGLNFLSITNNPVKKLSLKNLPWLKRIDLINTKVENIEIINCNSINYINLKNNEVADISFLHNTPAVTDLDISGNPIVDYSPLQTLRAVEILKVNGDLPASALNGFTYLKQIHLSEKASNPDLIQKLTNKKLFPGLTVIGHKTQEVKSLENKIGVSLIPTLPGGITDWVDNRSYLLNSNAELVAMRLRRLNLSRISSLEEFRHIEILDLRINKIRDIKPIQALSELRELHLYGNQIREIPFDFLDSLPNLTYINLARNPIKNIPKEIFDKDQNIITELRVYLGSMKGERAYLHQAKMILIGNGEVGKSSIRIKLLDKKKPLPKKEDRTQGLDIETYTIKDLPPAVTGLDKKIDFDLSIWDFGGQGRYREVQQLFCGRKALYIFVTAFGDDPKNEDYIGFEYWLSMARAYGYDHKENWQSPIIHVVNKCDLGKKPVNEGTLVGLFSNIHDFVKISCETLQNFDKLEEVIKLALPKVSKDIFFNQFSKKWFLVKEALHQRRHENYITLDAYYKICTQNKLNRGESDLWLEYLDRMGDLIYFRDNPDLGNFIVLNPLWVKNCAYQILDSTLIQKGVLEKQYLPYIWKDFTEYEHNNLMALMIAYKLCYPGVDSHKHTSYIVPALLPEKKPAIPEAFFKQHYELKFDYSPFIPAGTVNKLIVALNQHIYQDLKWKNGCLLHLMDGNNISFAEVIEDWEKNAVFVRLSGNNLHALYNLVRQTLSQLLDELKKIKILDVLQLETRIKVDDDYELPKTIIKFGKTREYQFLFSKDVVETKKEEPPRKTVKVFIASSKELKVDREALRTFVSVENDRLIRKNLYVELVQQEYFIDSMVEDGLQSKYNEAITNCDIIITLFFTKVGPYTQQEFECAYESFIKTGKPQIYTYIKKGTVDMDTIDEEVMTLLSFKKKLKELKHYPTEYKNSAELTQHFGRQIQAFFDNYS